MSQAEILRELGLERTVMERNLKGLKEDMRYGQNSGIYYLCKESSLVSGKCRKHCVAIGPPKSDTYI